MGPKSLVKSGLATAEKLTIWTDVARTQMLPEQISLSPLVSIEDGLRIFKVMSKSGQ